MARCAEGRAGSAASSLLEASEASSSAVEVRLGVREGLVWSFGVRSGSLWLAFAGLDPTDLGVGAALCFIGALHVFMYFGVMPAEVRCS